MGPMRQATDAAIAALDNPDPWTIAVAQAAQRLADICDGEYHNASYFKEYQVAMRALSATKATGPSLDDLEDD